ncbi:hypothetical protein KY329_01900 [Candidatus Woesearchaeota archaeon]|nr:hypothetical protein [Candidatus Woesearchaeota archaeon]
MKRLTALFMIVLLTAPVFAQDNDPADQMRYLLQQVSSTNPENIGDLHNLAEQIHTLDSANPEVDWGDVLDNNAKVAIDNANLLAGGMANPYAPTWAGYMYLAAVKFAGPTQPAEGEYPPPPGSAEEEAAGAGTEEAPVESTGGKPSTLQSALNEARDRAAAGDAEAIRSTAGSIAAMAGGMSEEDIVNDYGAEALVLIQAARALKDDPNDQEALDAFIAAAEALPKEEFAGAVPTFGFGTAPTTGGVSLSASDTYVVNPANGMPVSREDAVNSLKSKIDAAIAAWEENYGREVTSAEKKEIEDAFLDENGYSTVSADVARWVASSGAQPYPVQENDPFFPNVAPGKYVYYVQTDEKHREPGVFYDNVHLITLSGRTQNNQIVVAEQREDIDIDGNSVPGTQQTRKFLFDAKGRTYDTIDTYQVNKGTAANPNWVTKGIAFDYDTQGITGQVGPGGKLLTMDSDVKITLFEGTPGTTVIGGKTVPTVTQSNAQTYYYDADAQSWWVKGSDDKWQKVSEASAKEIENQLSATPHGADMLMNADLQHSSNFIDGLLRLGAHSTLALPMFATIIEGYQMVQGLRWLWRWASPFTDEEVQMRKERIKQDFCLAGGVSNCITSAICDQQLEGRVPWTEEGRVVVTDLSGMPETGVYVAGYKMGPITLRGASADTLKAIFNSDSTYIGNKKFDFDDPDFDSYDIPETAKAYLYQVNYYVSNVIGTRDPDTWTRPPATSLSWNLEWRGTKNARWFPADQTLQPSASTHGNLFKYSFNDYDRICLTLSPPIEAGDGTGSHGRVCNDFVGYVVREPEAGSSENTYPPAATGGTAPGATI